MFVTISPHVAVMLQLVLELRKPLDDLLALSLCLKIMCHTSSTVDIVNAAGLQAMSFILRLRYGLTDYDNRPPIPRRDIREGGLVAGVVLCFGKLVTELNIGSRCSAYVSWYRTPWLMLSLVFAIKFRREMMKFIDEAYRLLGGHAS